MRIRRLFSEALQEQVAHGGAGLVRAARVAEAGNLSGACNFMDYVEVPPGASIGVHRHRPDEEEFYLLLGGRGLMQLEDETFAVGAGDLVRNPPGGRHGLANADPDEVLRLFVFELATR